jgi:hypothetical protein
VNLPDPAEAVSEEFAGLTHDGFDAPSFLGGIGVHEPSYLTKMKESTLPLSNNRA